MNKFFRLFFLIYLPVSAAAMLFSYLSGKIDFMSIFVPWIVITFTGLQNAVATYLTFNKKFTVFYGVFIGGVLFRLILIAVVTFIVLKFTNLIVYYYLIATSFFYILIQILEIQFISKSLKGKVQIKDS